MVRQPMFKSHADLLNEVNAQIKAWEKSFQCSTDVMKLQFQRSQQNKSIELIAWYRLAELRDELTERQKCDSNQ